MNHIAIDGPSGAGKSTIAKLLAKKLNCLYLDTGAMYRTVGLMAKRRGVDTHDDAALGKMLEGARIEARMTENGQRMLLDGEDVEDSIRTPEISMAASDVAACPSVRRALVGMQQEIARENDVVMDGRDIGTRVLPDAEHKFFLTASPEVRAKRRLDEFKKKGERVTLEEVLQDVRKRDEQDTTRKESPLTLAPDATEVPTDDLGIEDVVQVLLALMGKI
jgi:cytidylate kinase